MVTNGDNGTGPLAPGVRPWTVDYGRVTPLLVKSIQDLNSKVDNAQITSAINNQKNLKVDAQGQLVIPGSTQTGDFNVTSNAFNKRIPTRINRERFSAISGCDIKAI